MDEPQKPIGSPEETDIQEEQERLYDIPDKDRHLYDPPSAKGRPQYRTIANLRLDVEAAKTGRTWLLLPEGFRDMECGDTYPLPTRFSDLQTVVSIPRKPNKMDAGARYIKRCQALLKLKAKNRGSSFVESERIRHATRIATVRYRTELKEHVAEARAAVEEVKKAAAESIASLTDLFALGRKGLEGQMQAHLSGKQWQGEDISARAFRECFRMVTQAVKGLGLPSEQRASASEAVIEEVDAALRATREAVAMGTETETEN